MYYALLYDVGEDYLERRQPLREEHLTLARAAHDRGELFLGGAFAGPVDGALLVFKGDDRSAAEKFAQSDPYVREGLVKSWRVRQWNVVVGGK